MKKYILLNYETGAFDSEYHLHDPHEKLNEAVSNGADISNLCVIIGHECPIKTITETKITTTHYVESPKK